MIMNKVIAILGFVVLAGYAIPDASCAHSHTLAPPAGEKRSLIPAEHDGFIGPILKDEGLLHHTEQPSWNWLNLTHTDPHHTLGREPYHPAFFRHFYAPDGAALMFSWPFASVPPLWMGPQGSSNEPTLRQDDPMTQGDYASIYPSGSRPP
jgi:hypothetical protein